MIFILDQATKFWGEKFLHTRTIIPGILKFTPFYNPGFFFGFWHTEYLKLITVVLSCLVIYVTTDLWRKSRKKNGLLTSGIGLVWGGMLGNLADRLIRGSVFDFILLWRIPTFNLADTALTIGASFIIIHILFCEKTVVIPADSKRESTP
ncbi:MAG: signal peptidase II [Candidatus Omnitrophica bacterium]|nr:signal peptidase II [Candidatus Omnitrophota bacterium]